MFDRDTPAGEISACKWFPMDIILAIVVGALMVLVLLVLSSRRFASLIVEWDGLVGWVRRVL